MAKAAGWVRARRHWDSESPDSEKKEPLQSFLLAFSVLTVKERCNSEGWSRRDRRGNMGLPSMGRWVEKKRNIGVTKVTFLHDTSRITHCPTGYTTINMDT